MRCRRWNLLAALRGIEAASAAPRVIRAMPRARWTSIFSTPATLVLDTPALTLPHPRLAQRRFVLAPLAAIRPELILPGQDKPVAQLLRELDDPGKVRQVAPDW